MFGAIGQLASLAKSSTAGSEDASAELADAPKDNYDFGLQRWMKKRGKFYRPNLSANEVKEYKDAFRIIDLDGSGTLEVDELVQAMRALDQPVSVYEMTKLVEVIAPGKGFLNEIDFIELVHYRSLPNGTKQNHKTQTQERADEDATKPKKVQVSMGILAGTFRRKKALDLLMLPWEIRNDTMQEAGRQSELAQILIPQAQFEPVSSPKINLKSSKASKMHGRASSTNLFDQAGQTSVDDTDDYTEHLFSMPLLPPGLSKSNNLCFALSVHQLLCIKSNKYFCFTELKNEAIRQTIPTSYSATLMGRIQEKIQSEVALETVEISKTAFYLPPVHKARQNPYVENVNSRSLSPNTGRRQLASCFSDKDEFERQKQSAMKKYSFPSSIPMLKTPREMQEPYAFLAQQLAVSNQTSMNAKVRARQKAATKNARLASSGIDVDQVMKDAETLLQTAKNALRQSRRQALDELARSPTCALEHGRQASNTSSLNDSQTLNQLHNSPTAPALKSVQKLTTHAPEKFIVSHAEPIIRIFKAELVPVKNNRIKFQSPSAGAGSSAKDQNSSTHSTSVNDATATADVRESDSEPKMKSFMSTEKESSPYSS